VTQFSPPIHGWRFPNAFRRGPFAYGLCGGMVFAALDRYLFDVAMPETTAPPQSGPLWRELVRRQVDSMPAGMLWQLTRLVRRDDSQLAYEAWYEHRLAATTVAKGPVPLVLIRARRLRDMAQNHQVLAVGADDDEDMLWIYDPNWPGQRCFLCRDWENTILIHSHAGPQRGMFVQDYEPRKP